MNFAKSGVQQENELNSLTRSHNHHKSMVSSHGEKFPSTCKEHVYHGCLQFQWFLQLSCFCDGMSATQTTSQRHSWSLSVSIVKCVSHQHELRGCRTRKKLLIQKQHLKARLKFTADHMDKEKTLLEENSVVRGNKHWVVWPQWAAVCLDARRWGL